MSSYLRTFPIVVIAFLTIGLGSKAESVESPSPLRLAQTIPLPNVEGRIDHMALDVKGQRLFVAALGNNTLEVVDLRAGKRIHSLTEFHEPQGVAFLPEVNKLFVANAKGGVCDVLDGFSFKTVGNVRFGDDADNIRYDASTRRVYVGYGSGAIGIIDAAKERQIGDIKLEAHPESFQLEKSGTRIFVNLPEAEKIVVVDRDKHAVTSAWPTSGARGNFPMALDENHHRLFVGFRRPAKLVVFDTESGKAVATLDSPGDADDIFYDGPHRRIYVSGGEGFVGVAQQHDQDHYETIAKLATASGARTSFFAPELGTFFLAVPHRGAQKSEIRIYKID